MIYTITLNPAWDVTYRVHEIRPEGLHRAYAAKESAGGKGVNVARAVRHAGGAACAIACLGGLSGERIAATLESEGVDCIPVGVQGDTRTNVSVIADNGRAFEVNGEGNPIDTAAVNRIRRALLENLLPGDTIALCGSFPQFRDGSPASFWTELAEIAKRTETALVLDTGGTFLREIFLDGLPTPSLIKPNFDELRDLAWRDRPAEGENGGDPLPAHGTPAEYCALVESYLRASPVDPGKTAVLCTLGAYGAVYVDGSGSRYGAGPLSESGEGRGGHVSRRVSDAARVRLGDCGIDGGCRLLRLCRGARRDLTDGTCPVALFF